MPWGRRRGCRSRRHPSPGAAASPFPRRASLTWPGPRGVPVDCDPELVLAVVPGTGNRGPPGYGRAWHRRRGLQPARAGADHGPLRELTQLADTDEEDASTRGSHRDLRRQRAGGAGRGGPVRGPACPSSPWHGSCGYGTASPSSPATSGTATWGRTAGRCAWHRASPEEAL